MASSVRVICFSVLGLNDRNGCFDWPENNRFSAPVAKRKSLYNVTPLPLARAMRVEAKSYAQGRWITVDATPDFCFRAKT
jgi:hypothetical protein